MFKEELEAAVLAAMEAGKLLNERECLEVDENIGKDIKLRADKQSELLIIDYLKATQIPILSEECGFLGTDGDTFWIVDPIDGTMNYYRGLLEFCCVSIALWKDNAPVFGVINRFVRNDIYIGIIGEGATKNNIPISTSSITSVEDAVVATGFPVNSSYDTEYLSIYIKMIQRFKKVRMLGSAAIMGALIADGTMDAYMEDRIMLWDVAAAAAIVESAGGAVCLDMLQDNQCICKLFASDCLMKDYYAEVL
jgi:myo-inositol-1(or 4)-monophosphatase